MVAVPATGGARLPGVHKSGKLGIRALAPEVDGLPLPQRLKPGSKRTAKCTAEAVLHPGESTLNLFYGLTVSYPPAKRSRQTCPSAVVPFANHGSYGIRSTGLRQPPSTPRPPYDIYGKCRFWAG